MGRGGPGRNSHFCQILWQEFLAGMCSLDKGEGRLRNGRERERKLGNKERENKLVE